MPSGSLVILSNLTNRICLVLAMVHPGVAGEPYIERAMAKTIEGIAKAKVVIVMPAYNAAETMR
jgi:hypothetical protein